VVHEVVGLVRATESCVVRRGVSQRGRRRSG
jgi:hypothetical protein